MHTRPVHRIFSMRLLFVLVALAVALPSAVVGARIAPATPGSASTQVGDKNLYIVVQSAPAVALYRGGVAGLAATNPEVRGEVKLDSDSAASTSYRQHLRTERSELTQLIGASIGHQITVVDHYDFALNGFSARLTAAEADAVRAITGVAFVVENEELPLLTDSGPEWMNADEVWDGSAGAGAANKGEGIVTGIIDTGVNHLHPSFAQVGPVDGYVHTNPRFPIYYGICAANPPPAPTSQCNNKLIGMHDFLGGTGIDDNGHGSHTASTVAGNVVNATLLTPTTTLPSTQISGVAPHANVISYRACQSAALPVVGTCPLNALIAAIDQATVDVPDVVNFSIGGGSTDPWADPLGMAFFGTHAAGVFVAASAGNSGPNGQTIGRPSNSPWLMSVGASTSNRRPTGVVTATKSNGAPLQISGLSLTSGIGPVALVDAKAPGIGNELCDPFTPAQAVQVAGKIVVCVGSSGRVAKGANVQAAGGVGMVLVASPGYKRSAISDAHVIPTVMIGEWDGDDLRAWLAGSTSPQATLTGVSLETNSALADRMAGFSSRGPDLASPNVIKPDVTAPGVSILAAWANDAARAGDDYGMIQGTSMSSPHAAGAGALLAALHPTWTPDQIKSALMSTAFTVPNGGKETVPVTKEDHVTPADPFDMGGGRIDIAAAANAGFTVEETVANYQDANPALGGEAQTLNIASLANNACAPSCSWTRTLKSTASSSVSYTVSVADGDGFDLTVEPSTFALAAGGTQVITVTATDEGLVDDVWQFGALQFVPSDAGIPDQHFPVAVTASAGVLLPPDCEILETLVASDTAFAEIPDHNDIREVHAAGLYPTYGGIVRPNVRFRMVVEELGVGGELPPNQHWQVRFVTPEMPATLTSYFVQMITDASGQPSFVYGTINASNQFSVLGAADGGSYDLPTSTINWVIAANKVSNPQVGDELTAITGVSGAAVSGVVTTNVKTLDPGTYSLVSCSVTPTPEPCVEPPFNDVPVDHPFCAEILWLKTNGIANGFADGSYQPAANITRMAMAAFLVRVVDAAPTECTSPPFSDVPVEHPFCPEIDWLKTAGITTGFQDGTFRPSAQVTRQAMAAFLARIAAADPEACTSAPFTDVPVEHPFCPEITWLKENGITTGFEDGTFRGSDNVTRQAMAAFIFRTSVLLQ